MKKYESMKEYLLSEINIPVGCFCKSSTGKLVGWCELNGTKWNVYKCKVCGLLWR